MQKPDHRKGPRFKAVKLKVIRTSYKAFNAKHPGLITLKDYVSFFKLQALKFQEEVVNNPEGVTLSGGLGVSALLFKDPPKVKKILDRDATLKGGKEVSHRNYISKGLIGTIYWSTNSGIAKNLDLKIWRFQASKKFKGLASRGFTNFPHRYKRYLHRKWTQLAST